MASCMGIEVYKDTTSRLHGYGSVFVGGEIAGLDALMSSRLFSRCAGTSFSIGLRALHWVCPLELDTMGCILITGPVLWVLVRW